MTVEELEIIVKANVDNAMKNIKSLVNEVKKQAKSMQTSMTGVDFSKVKVDFSTAFSDATKKSMQKCNKIVINAVDKTKKEVAKISTTPISIQVNIDEAKDKINELESKIEYLSKLKNVSSYQMENIEKYKAQIATLQEAIDNFEKNSNTDILNFDIESMSADEAIAKMEELKKVRDSLFDDKHMVPEENEKLFDAIVMKCAELESMIPYLQSLQNSMEAPESFEKASKTSNVSNEAVNLPENGETPEFVIKVNSVNALDEITTFKEAWLNILSTISKEFPQTEKFNEEINKSINDAIAKVTDFKTEVTKSLNDIKIHTTDWLDEQPLIQKINSIKNSASVSVQKITDTFYKLGNISNAIAIPFDMMKQKGIEATLKVKQKIEDIKNSFQKPIQGIKNFLNKLGLIKNKSKEVSKSTKKMDLSGAFKKGLDSIKKFTLSLLSVRTAFSVISKAAQSYLSFDEELNKSLQNSWATLGSLLAPALELVINLFAKATSYVAAFVKALTGVDLVAKANAKALDKQNKSASQTKSLSSIDDISNLSSGKGSESNLISTVDVDSSKIDDFINKMRKRLEKLFEPVKKSWDKFGGQTIDSMKYAFDSCKTLAESIGSSLEEVWSNGTGETFVSNLLIGFNNIFNIIGDIKRNINDVWNDTGLGTSIIQNIFDFINQNMETINTVGGYFRRWTLSDEFKNTINSIFNIFKDITDFAKDISDSILKWVISEDFQVALEKVFGFIDDIFESVKDLCDWLLDMYNKYLKPVIDEKLLPALTDVVNAIMDIWNVAKPIIDEVVRIIKNVLEPIIEGLCDVIGGIIDVVRGISRFISGVFTGDWKKAWEGVKLIFKGIWDTLGGIIKTPLNTILAGVEGLVNAIIHGLNFIKKSLNKLSFDIPDWVPVVGGNKWGFNFKLSDDIKLPRLKNGTVATEPLVAEIAEYSGAKSNPEIVSPVSLMKQAFRETLSEFEFGGTRVERLVVDVAGDNFYDGSIDYINKKSTRKGVSVMKEGAY